MTEIRLAKAALLAEGKTETFTVPLHKSEGQGFLLRHRGNIRAFLNECPHWSVDLDLGDEHFFDEGLELIYCKNHGALFRPTDGVCETGPCLGRSLTQYSVEVEGEDVLVTV